MIYRRRAAAARFLQLLIFVGASLLVTFAARSQVQRVLGADISYWNCGTSANGIVQSNWNIAFTNGNRVFVQIRATRGGTTGLGQTSGTPGNPTTETLSRRYDDSRFLQNITRATAAGMVTGPYHFARPDVAGNTGTDEADHFIEMAGVFMRPGYMMPMYDMEATSGDNNQLRQFALDFSARLYEVMQIRPCIYINGQYSGFIDNMASVATKAAFAQPQPLTPSVVGPAFPMLWNARYSDNNTNPVAIPIQTGDPKNTYTTVSAYYGPWDDFGNFEPWTFWQYASVLSLPGFNNVDANVDGDVCHGDIEYMRNYLVPAVWWNDNSGDWSALANWNSGQPAPAPVTPSDQAPPYAYTTNMMPIARLPGAAGSGPNSGQYDTVILERPNANIAVTLSTGTHNIRKLYMRESLNIVGGSLTVNYNPTYRPDTNSEVLHGGPISAQFSGPVALSNGASFSVHTLRVDTNRIFTVAGGTLTFNNITLMPHPSTPAKIFLAGDPVINPFANATATIASPLGAGTVGSIDLTGGTRTLNVGNGTSEVDLSVDVPIGNGALTKAGAGTMRLNNANTYAGGTTVSAGRLLVNNPSGSGTGTGGVAVNGGFLGGTGIISGVVTLGSAGTIAPGTASTIGKLTLGSAPVFNSGTNFTRINRNGGSPLSDRLALSSGALNYSGMLVVSNAGAALAGGEVFTNFSAPIYSGAFTATVLPSLSAGLNWDLTRLTVNGTIKVNRRPVANLLTASNTIPAVLEIPFATLTGSATDVDGDTIILAGVNLTTTNGITLNTNGTSVFYSNNVSTLDQFSYVVTDGRGGSVTGLVNIVNIAAIATPPAQFVGQPSVSGGLVTLHVSGGENATYYIERSTNLSTWDTISTSVAPPGGVFDFVDDFHDLPVPALNAFYRLRWLP